MGSAVRHFSFLDVLVVAVAVAVVAGFQDVAAMGQTVEQGGGHLGVAEHGRPFGEAEVGGDGDTLRYIQSDQFAAAINRSAGRWSSFPQYPPGSPDIAGHYPNQRARSWDFLYQKYSNHLMMRGGFCGCYYGN